MDGWTLLFDLRETLHESSDSDWLNDQSSYTYLYEAAIELNARTASITSTQNITSVATQAEYNLNPDFLALRLTDREGDYYVKVNDGTSDNFIKHKSYSDMVYDNLTDDQSIPNYFSIKHATTQEPNVTGTASAAGTTSNGEAILTDTSSSTKFSTVSVGDLVHNTTDGTHGIVLSKTSNTVLATALFDTKGDAASWGISDAYIIVPQARFALIFEPPFSTSGYTITVDYIQKPAPVFSPYRSYQFPIDCKRALVESAAGRYKYRDRNPNVGEAYYQHSDRNTKLTGGIVQKATNRGGFRMNLRKRVN
jgi:hypothetical protein